jgi:hypothetical protein
MDMIIATASQRAAIKRNILGAIAKRFPNAKDSTALRALWPSPKPPAAVLYGLLNDPVATITSNVDLYKDLPKILSTTAASLYGEKSEPAPVTKTTPFANSPC